MGSGHWRLGVGCRGLTLVELLAVLAVTGVLLIIAIPSFSSLMYSSRLRGAADVLGTSLRQSMSESAKRGSDVLMTFQGDVDGANWCYGLSIETHCDCRASGDCSIDGMEHVTHASSFPGVLATPTHSTYTFKPKRSTVTAGNITFTSQDKKQLRVIVSGYGRIRPCSPSGIANVSGYPVCP